MPSRYCSSETYVGFFREILDTSFLKFDGFLLKIRRIDLKIQTCCFTSVTLLIKVDFYVILFVITCNFLIIGASDLFDLRPVLAISEFKSVNGFAQKLT